MRGRRYISRKGKITYFILATPLVFVVKVDEWVCGTAEPSCVVLDFRVLLGRESELDRAMVVGGDSAIEIDGRRTLGYRPVV